MDNKSLYRILRMIALMSNESAYTAKQLAIKFDVSIKSIYRYLELLKDAGFLINKDKQHRYSLEKYNASIFSEKLVSFSVDEASLIKDALLATHSSHPLKNQTLSKLFALSELDDIIEIIYNHKVANNIRQLKRAIQDKKQVMLIQYHSANSNTISDRKIEPVSFHLNMKYLFAYDIKNKQVKQFKPDRIESVTILDNGFHFEQFHKNYIPDVFGMNGIPVFTVDLKLNVRAANLLKEEFPGSEKMITGSPKANHFIFTAECKGYDGVGRFVLGLPEDVEVLGTREFGDYLVKKMGKMKKLRKSLTAKY